jgi:hypothetical protein
VLVKSNFDGADTLSLTMVWRIHQKAPSGSASMFLSQYHPEAASQHVSIQKDSRSPFFPTFDSTFAYIICLYVDARSHNHSKLRRQPLAHLPGSSMPFAPLTSINAWTRLWMLQGEGSVDGVHFQ